MSSTRSVWLLMCVLLVAMVAGCSGGGEPAPESEEAAAPPPAAPAEPAEDANAGEEEPAAGEDVVTGEFPVVEMQTNLGTMKIELYPDKAPKTVDNFLSYVRGGFYDGTIFHRVVPGFVIQGGGFTADMDKKDTEPPIENEADNGLLNARGTICMARTNDPSQRHVAVFHQHQRQPRARLSRSLAPRMGLCGLWQDRRRHRDRR